MWTLASMLLLLGSLAAMNGQAAPAGSLHVMSFNIRYANQQDGPDYWNHRREMVFDLLRRQRLDIFGVQEALHGQIVALCAALPEFEMVGVGRDDGTTAGEYSALFFRRDRFQAEAQGTFWFSDTPEVPGSKHWGNTVVRICTWARLKDKASGAAFTVYNLHLDHRSQPSRERSVALLLHRIKAREAREPVIVMGDFNAGEENPAIRALLANVAPLLRDTFRSLHPDAKEAGTFHGFRGAAGRDKIDYIFVSPECDVLEAAIVRDHRNGRYPSDHFPVTARLRLAPPQPGR